MEKRYLIDENGGNYCVVVGYRSDLSLILEGLGVADITGHTFNFDIGREDETAEYTGLATIISATDPQELLLIIPTTAFTETHRRLVLQIRHTDTEATPIERIIFKGFLDVINPVTPKP